MCPCTLAPLGARQDPWEPTNQGSFEPTKAPLTQPRPLGAKQLLIKGPWPGRQLCRKGRSKVMRRSTWCLFRNIAHTIFISVRKCLFAAEPLIENTMFFDCTSSEKNGQVPTDEQGRTS